MTNEQKPDSKREDKRPYDNTFSLSFWPPKMNASGEWLNRNGLAIVSIVCIITAIVLTILALTGVISAPQTVPPVQTQ